MHNPKGCSTSIFARCTFSKTRVSSTDKVPSDVLGTIIPRRNQVGRHWHFQGKYFLLRFSIFHLGSLSLFSNIYLKTQSCLGTWIPRGKNIPNVCYWNYNGRGENARGKWFKDGETSGSWTLTKQAFKDHFRSCAFYSGLVNMSDDLVNVCYQNSVMQCLYNSEFLGKIQLWQLWGRSRHFGKQAAELSNEEKSAIRVFQN